MRPAPLLHHLAVTALLLGGPAEAAPAAPSDPLDQQEAMAGQLLLWGGASMLGGAALLASPVPWVRDFGVQHLAWGAIDAGIGLWARRGIAEKRTRPPDPAEREGFRRVLLLNAGLDVGYVAVGAWLAGRDATRGHGLGIMTQGGFLLLFDGWHAWRASSEADAGLQPPSSASTTRSW